MGFSEEQLVGVRPLWERMLAHRFLRETRDGTVARETFATWMRQDYLFVEAAIPFLAALIPKGPPDDWASLSGIIGALQKELTLFEERAAAVGVALRGTQPAFVNHAYIQFLPPRPTARPTPRPTPSSTRPRRPTTTRGPW
jgi:thiaminase